MPSSSSGLYPLDATGLTRRRAQRLNRSYTTPRGTTELVEAGRDPSEVFQFVEETLDEIALAINRLVDGAMNNTKPH